jgi:release factor glutamine methyltransferase
MCSHQLTILSCSALRKVYSQWSEGKCSSTAHRPMPSQCAMEEIRQKPDRWTVKDVLEWTAHYFKEKGIRTSRLDAEVLLAHALSTDRLRLYLNFDRPLSSDERSLFRELVRRRAAREPVAYIVGRKEFWSLPIRTVPGVLIPRPETEVLVEVVLDKIRRARHPRILELGTGSGAVAMAVLHENPGARMVVTDIVRQALEITRSNADDLQVLDRLDLVASTLFDAIRPGAEFDVVCSNPPYIPTETIAQLEPEVRDFEPLSALDGGPNGFDVIRRLVEEAGAYLKIGGALVLEVGDSQAESVAQLLSGAGCFRDVRAYRDLSGTERVVTGDR